MTTTELSLSRAPAAPTSLGGKLLDLIGSPVEVFEEVAATPPTPANWRIPVLLVCLTNLIFIGFPPAQTQTASAFQEMVQTAKIAPPDVPTLFANFRLISVLTVCAAAFAGTFWAALVLWFIARAFLKVRVSYWKSLEVAGLSGFVLVFGAIVTAFLIALSDDPAARPTLSLLLPRLHPGARLRAMLDLFNIFHLWAATLLSIGLSKLSAASFKESAFWVFGYWIVLKGLFFLLAGGID